MGQPRGPQANCRLFFFRSFLSLSLLEVPIKVGAACERASERSLRDLRAPDWREVSFLSVTRPPPPPSIEVETEIETESQSFRSE